MTTLDGFFFFKWLFGVSGTWNVVCLTPGDMRAGATFQSKTKAAGSGSPVEIR